MKNFLLIICLCISIGVQGQHTNNFLLGMAQLQKQAYAESINAFTIAINDNNETTKSYLHRGIAYYKLNEILKADKDFIKAKDLGNTNALLWLAKIQAINNNPGLSTDYLKKYLQKTNYKNKENALKSTEFKNIYYSEKWQSLISNDWFSDIENAYKEANYYLQKKQFTEGIEKLNKSILHFGEQAELLYLRGLLYFESDKTLLAVLDFKKAVELSPENIEYLIALGDAYLQKKEYEKAEGYFKTAYRLKPEEFANYKKLAKTELACNKLNYAESTLKEYLQYFESDTSAITLMANTYFALKQYQNSILQWNKLMLNYPIKLDWYLNRATCYLETGTYKYAAYDLSMCLDLDPNNRLANLHLGTVQYKMGNTDKACYYWKRAESSGELTALKYLIDYCK